PHCGSCRVVSRSRPRADRIAENWWNHSIPADRATAAPCAPARSSQRRQAVPAGDRWSQPPRPAQGQNVMDCVPLALLRPAQTQELDSGRRCLVATWLSSQTAQGSKATIPLDTCVKETGFHKNVGAEISV